MGITHKEEKLRIARDILADFLPLDTSGRAICPYHNEKTPSFGLYWASRNKMVRLHCFGCHKDISLAAFIQEKTGIQRAQGSLEDAQKARIVRAEGFKRRYAKLREDLTELATKVGQIDDPLGEEAWWIAVSEDQLSMEAEEFWESGDFLGKMAYCERLRLEQPTLDWQDMVLAGCRLDQPADGNEGWDEWLPYLQVDYHKEEEATHAGDLFIPDGRRGIWIAQRLNALWPTGPARDFSFDDGSGCRGANAPLSQTVPAKLPPRYRGRIQERLPKAVGGRANRGWEDQHRGVDHVAPRVQVDAVSGPPQGTYFSGRRPAGFAEPDM